MKDLQVILPFGALILMVVFYSTEDKVIGLLSGLPLLTLLTWALVVIQRSNIDSQLKRISWIMLLVMFSILGRMVFQMVN
ncbi:MAG: hypothetical protein AAGA77_18805 [Bacteroidota bacterium]